MTTSIPRYIRLPGTLHILQVSDSQHDDSLVKGGSYLASVMIESPAGTVFAALTRSDCAKLRNYLTQLLERES